MFIDQFQSFIIDLDGTIYYKNELVHYAHELIEYLSNQEKEIIYLTNNSTNTIDEIKENMAKKGIVVSGNSHIITAGMLASEYLLQMKGRCSVWVFGSEALKGIIGQHHEIDCQSPQYLIAGRNKNMDYEEIEAGINLLNKGTKLLLTNIDETHPNKESVVLETKLTSAPFTEFVNHQYEYVGKPSKFTYEFIVNKYGLKIDHAVVIGDNLKTDILGANNFGLKSIHLNHNGDKNNHIVPTKTVRCLSELLEVE